MNDAAPVQVSQRFTSLDAFRGLIMATLLMEGIDYDVFEGHPFLNFIAVHTEHVRWEGCVYWDLIQPAFMFMVGVAMPFSFAKRRSMGASFSQIYIHAVQRCIGLILLALVFTSIQEGKITPTFINVLPQIALGYIYVALFVERGIMVQAIAAGLILLVYTTAWALFSADPWQPGNNNIGGAVDRFLNSLHLIPYSSNGGNYVVTNFIPESSTMLFGVMSGTFMRQESNKNRVVVTLLVAGIAALFAGWALSPVVPMIKRIWTASFCLYSTGWVVLMMAFFYWIIEIVQFKRWAFFLVVVGMNSIAAYVITQLFSHPIERAVGIFIAPFLDLSTIAGVTALFIGVFAVQWYILYFFYKHKIFFKL